MNKYWKHPEPKEIRTGTFHYWITIPEKVTRPEASVHARFSQWLIFHNRRHLRVNKITKLADGQWEITTRKVCPTCGR